MFKLFLGTLLITFCLSSSNAQISPSKLAADIDQLEKLIKTKHVAPFRLVSTNHFASIIKKAKKKIASTNVCNEACYVEILKIIAALNDGHSVMNSNSREMLFGYLPITTTWFKEGLYITRVAEEHRNILGGRLEAIDGVRIETVLSKLRKVIPHANESRFKKFAFSYLRMPGLLYGLDITKSGLAANFKISLDGKNVTIALKNMGDEEYDKTSFVSYDDITSNLPFYKRRSSEYYWDHYDSENKVFYFKYNRVGNMDAESASSFATRMWAKVDSLEVDKFVLDIRNNGGGQFAFSMSFIQGILDRPKINTQGKFFVVSGFETFSAALDILRNLEVKSNAIILGEAPGDYAASSGDPETYTLGNSKIKLQLSSVFHPTVFKDDMRKEIILDKFIETSWSDYKQGKDAIYSYILGYNDPPPQTVLAEKYINNLGRYNYDKDKHIEIKSEEGKLLLEISKSLNSPLFASKSNRLHTQINGLTVELKRNCIKVNFPDGKKEKFKKTTIKKSGIEHLYDGNFETAKSIYQAIKTDDPNSQLTRDGRFSNLALFAFFELRKTDRDYASTIAKGILNLGIELNDGEAPFCEFSLRFY